MKKKDIEYGIGDKCLVVLKSGHIYTAIITKVTDTALSFKDKYDLAIIVDLEDVSSIQEARQ